MTELTLHILLFALAGAGMLLAPLIIGRFIRPSLPTDEKLAVYECGEPAIGSSYIQFDIRFYVVALLFIVFDVEVVFFFPWATVFGGATQLADARLTEATRMNLTDKLLNLPPGTTTPESVLTSSDALLLAHTGMLDLLVFFGVLLVGFAYIWFRGDLDWVRSMMKQNRPKAS
ncbi:MAG TPA: NADH-quinone oxidoreductase subunit A [Planctomicrobium sp.]|nr:NADH-quinone oxidoreductase subunit A [Planctomicrobium sp.]